MTATLDTIGIAPDRTPPQDLAAEQSVLGTMMMSKDAIAVVMGIIQARDFYKPAHELIFTSILDLYSEGIPVDPITVAEHLTKQGAISRAGGHVYIADLYGTVSIAANSEYYARIVQEKAILRRLVEASIRIAQLGYAGQGEVGDIAATAQHLIFDAVAEQSPNEYYTSSSLLKKAWDIMDARASGAEHESSIPSGFFNLDQLTHGFHPGELIIVAARPSIGKSTLGIDFVRHAAIHNHIPTAVFSLEMSAAEIMLRILSAEASVPHDNIKQGKLQDYWEKIGDVTLPIDTAPLYVDDSPNMTVMEIRAKARRMMQQHDLKIIVIDYIQLMSSGKRQENRQTEVSEISRQLKLMAKELAIPVVAISQLNRTVEQRADKKPFLSDLRESGSLEQDADLVLLLHRHDYYNKQSRPGEAELNVAKNRNGRTGIAHLIFRGSLCRFEDNPE